MKNSATSRTVRPSALSPEPKPEPTFTADDLLSALMSQRDLPHPTGYYTTEEFAAQCHVSVTTVRERLRVLDRQHRLDRTVVSSMRIDGRTCPIQAYRILAQPKGA